MRHSVARAAPLGLLEQRRVRLLLVGTTGKRATKLLVAIGALVTSHLIIFELGARQGLKEGLALNNEITKVVKLAFARKR